MINWSKAPKDATHHGEFENHECWYQVDGGEVLSWYTDAWGGTCWKPEQLTANNEDTVIFKPRPEVNPVYTQEMHEAGELPSVGMEVMIKSCSGNEFFDRFDGKVLAVKWHDKNLKGDDTAVFSYIDDEGDIVYHAFIYSMFKPLTPPVKLVDGKAYQFDYDGSSAVGFAFEGATFVSRKDGECQGVNMSDCTNIKPLTVEK